MSANLVLITGDDEDLIRKETSKAIKSAAGENADEFSLDIIKETDDSTPLQLLNDVIKSIQTPSFFGKKTICLQNCTFFDSEGAKTDKSKLSTQFRTLAAIISEGVPDDIFLILSGKSLDSRKSLYKSCTKANAQIHSYKKLQLMNRNWQEQVSGLLKQSAAEKGVNLQHNALEYLIQVIGPETGRIEPEMEKVKCACPDHESISYNDIADICTGNASTAFWAYSNALGDRKLKMASKAIDCILLQSKDPEQAVMGLLLQTAKHFKLLLKAKLFMQQAQLKNPGQVDNFLRGISAADKERFKNNEFAKLHPFRAKMLASSASLYNGQELINAIKLFTETNRKLVYSPVSRRLLLEQLTFAIIKGSRKTLQGS
jgi:DNA polymerase III delta subunit